MKVKFSPDTRDDFGKYKDYLQKVITNNQYFSKTPPSL